MKRKIIFGIVAVVFFLAITACRDNKQLVNNDVTEKDNISIDSIKENNLMKLIINGKQYTANLESNETVERLINMLPLELNMSELNGNEKYIYLNENLPVNQYNPKEIKVGDIMLYGSNCLVIFYKSFNTSYSYTKIGHIDNLPDLGSDSIYVKLEK